VAGYGRTATEWVPGRLHAAPFTVQSVTAATLALTGAAGDTCKGDSGGPAFRESGGQAELVALNDTSWQHGCLGETGTNQGSYEVRVDDLGDWITQQTTDPVAAVAFGVSTDGVYHLFSATPAGAVYETYWKGDKTLTTAKLADIPNG
jgi:secreted trypsin-like serine protease